MYHSGSYLKILSCVQLFTISQPVHEEFISINDDAVATSSLSPPHPSPGSPSSSSPVSSLPQPSRNMWWINVPAFFFQTQENIILNASRYLAATAVGNSQSRGGYHLMSFMPSNKAKGRPSLQIPARIKTKKRKKRLLSLDAMT